jgi:biopolymer transport protein ExbD/biopolymer transport protein TolR
MSLAGKKRRQSLRPICEINVAAFAGIQLVLWYILISPDVKFQDFIRPTADLAKVAHAESMRAANREDALVVAVQRDGRVWLGYERIAPGQLPDRIHQGLRAGAERKVYIKADARAKYGRVREVLEAVQSSGVEKVGFLVYQRNPPYPKP